jgi:hypothetical protein
MIIPRYVNDLYLVVTMIFNQKRNREGDVCRGGYAPAYIDVPYRNWAYSFKVVAQPGSQPVVLFWVINDDFEDRLPISLHLARDNYLTR